MSLDPYLQNLLIRAQIAEAHRQAALRQLVRQATPTHPRSRAGAVIRRVVRAGSLIWPRRRIETAVLP
jgi:hypothetical protein